jgi:hypothetical protein
MNEEICVCVVLDDGTELKFNADFFETVKWEFLQLTQNGVVVAFLPLQNVKRAYFEDALISHAPWVG